MAGGISWCIGRYRDTPAPFRFRHADLRNPAYNPGGSITASDYRFEYDDHAFDLVIATSLFTHLLADAADHYLAEAARVLAPGGRMLCTWYVVPDADRLDPPGGFRRMDPASPALVRHSDVPEEAVAFDEDWVRDRLAAHGLRLRSLARGTWAGREGRSLQDIIVADRPSG